MLSKNLILNFSFEKAAAIKLSLRKQLHFIVANLFSSGLTRKLLLIQYSSLVSMNEVGYVLTYSPV